MRTLDEAYPLLSKREKTIYHDLVTDQSISDIAEKRNIHVSTVKFHTTAIYKKFKVKNRYGLIIASYSPMTGETSYEH